MLLNRVDDMIFIALLGFGDVFPSEPRIILVNMFFIVMGVVLFSMCYFILQGTEIISGPMIVAE